MMFRTREQRHTVLVRARMRGPGPTTDVCVRNVSARGMMLQAPAAPPVGSYVEVMLPGMSLTGRVVWASERRFGLTVRERVPVARLTGRGDAPDAPESASARAARAQAVAARHSDSRASGRAAEFCALIGGGVAVALLLGLVLFGLLSELAEQVRAGLQG